jgi:hypothetical protein
MGQSVPVSMLVEREGKVVTGTKWKCDLVLYERHLGSVAVSDDGAHGDGPAGDGVFGAAIVTGKTKGHHEVRVEATLPAALGGATIDGIGLFEVYTIEDLVAVPGSVTLSKSPALEGDRVEILGTIANHGSTRVPNLEVEFEDGGGELGAVNVDLAAGETCDVELPWTVTPGASHDLAVYVSPFALDETDFANNTSRTTVVMGQPLPRREGSGDHPCKTVTGTVAPTSPQKPQRHPH